MLKKICMLIVLFFVSVQAESDDSFCDNQLQKLVYAMGMSLAQQDPIYDQASIQNALINVSQDVPAMAKILQFFLISDQEMVMHHINSIPALIDYQFEKHYDLAVAAVVWLAAFQDVFVIFNQLHSYNCSFEIWSADMEYLESWTDTLQFEENPDYAILWQACVNMIHAQDDFTAELNALTTF